MPISAILSNNELQKESVVCGVSCLWMVEYGGLLVFFFFPTSKKRLVLQYCTPPAPPFLEDLHCESRVPALFLHMMFLIVMSPPPFFFFKFLMEEIYLLAAKLCLSFFLPTTLVTWEITVEVSSFDVPLFKDLWSFSCVP